MSLAVPPIRTPDWERVTAQAVNSLTARFTEVPASASSPGKAGQIAFDGSHLYCCVAQDTWVRAALASW